MTRLIDADALIDFLDNQDNRLDQISIEHMARINIYSIINSMPTVEERPHGEWILSPNWSGYCCSNCGANPLDTNIDTTRVKSKDVLRACPFCRLCGAKMEAENGD